MRNFSKALKVPKPTQETFLTKLHESWQQTTWKAWFDRNFKFPIKDFCTGIKNLVKWFPIVWKDRDWDDAYILYVLKFKLINTRDRILKNNIISDDDQAEIKRDITICVKLIDSLIDEKYSLEYQDYIKKEWVLTDFISEDPSEEIEPGSKELTFKVLENNLMEYLDKYEADFNRTDRWFQKNRPDYQSDSDNWEYFALVMADLRQKKANALLWKIINDRIQRWWD